MKVGEFVKALQEMPQDAEITFTVGHYQQSREVYAHALLDEGVPVRFRSCLEDMEPTRIKSDHIICTKDKYVDIILRDNLSLVGDNDFEDFWLNCMVNAKRAKKA
jgi:hypothetical protein